MSIENHRKAIDQLDEKIVRLLNERTLHALAIGKDKRSRGEEIYAPHREREVFKRLKELNQGPILQKSLEAIYREIMSGSLCLEKSMTIAYLGPEATFTHQAAVNKFGASLSYSAQKTIPDVFTEVSKGRAEYGVVPVENSTEGVVTHTLDMFVDSDLKIVAQIVLPIRHFLARKNRRGAIEKLFVHPQTMAQCRKWIQYNLPAAELIETSSNSRSAEQASQDGRSAAVTTELAAERHGLKILHREIQDSADNATRFLVLGRQCGPPTGDDRTSLILSVKDQVGALYHALAPFSKFKINMTKIESRPSKRRPWEYFFFVDCGGHMDDPQVGKAIAHFEEHCSFVKVLGSYPNAGANQLPAE